MKKIAILILCLMLVLCACGEDAPAATTAATTPTTPATQPTQPATEEATAPATEPATEATQAPTEAQPSAMELAQSCLDKDVQELFALIGEPNSSEYLPSCLGEGEDGNLYYDGFTVYTYKEGDSEIVQFVE